MKKALLLLAFLPATFLHLTAQETTAAADSTQSPKLQYFVGYDFGEAMVNRFRSLSGEVGVSLPNKHLVRLVHMNVYLTEQHLSSDFVATVQGSHVEGRLFGFEAFYSYPVLKWRNNNEAIYVSPSLGYYKNSYSHTELDVGFSQQSPTAGVELSYRETNPFGIRGLYYAITFPMRVQFNPHDKTTLGSTTISSNRFDGNIWFFVGYQF